MSGNGVVLLSMALLVSACAYQGGMDLEREGERLEKTQDAFLSALHRQDADTVADHFAENGALHIANMPPIQGRDAIAGFYSTMFGHLDYSMATPDTLRMSSGADMAHASGEVTNVFDGVDGQQEYHGKFLIIWEKDGGEWLVRYYAVSNDRAE